MKKDLLISFMIENKTQEYLVVKTLQQLLDGYHVVNLETKFKNDNEGYNYIHAKFYNLTDIDIIYIKSYIRRALPSVNKVGVN